jgi:hypothetical protein
MSGNMLKKVMNMILVCFIISVSLLAATVLKNMWSVPTFGHSSPLSPQTQVEWIIYLEGRTYSIAIVTNDTRFTGELMLFRAAASENDVPIFRTDVLGSGIFDILVRERGFYKLMLANKYERGVMQSTRLLEAKGFDLNAVLSLVSTSATLLLVAIVLMVFKRKRYFGKHSSG